MKFVVTLIILLEYIYTKGIIIPFYSNPSPIHPNNFDKLLAFKPAEFKNIKIYAIIGSNNGPGTAFDNDYLNATKYLRTNGVNVLGYVYTSSGKRELIAVKTDMDLYNKWFGIQDYFFDEVAGETGKEAYYTELVNYAKIIKANTFTVGNPGLLPPISYAKIFNVIFIYESPGLPNLADYNSYSAQFINWSGFIPYDVPTITKSWVQSALTKVDYLYITDLGGIATPNPWDGLPKYFGDLLSWVNEFSSNI